MLPLRCSSWSLADLGPPVLTSPPFAGPPQQLATSSFLLFLLTGIISVAFLLLPLQDELGSQLPQVLHVSLGQKLVAAYILGEHGRGTPGPTSKERTGGRLLHGLSSFSYPQASSPWCSSGPELPSWTHPLLRRQGPEAATVMFAPCPFSLFSTHPSVFILPVTKHPGIYIHFPS